ncbi:MAG: SPOR domain-containing protein [Marinilabiliaceae bacterium]
MRGIFVFIFVLVAASLLAREPDDLNDPDGNVFEILQAVEDDEGTIHINQSERMEKLVLTHIDMNERADGVEGYRVQLFSGGGSKAREEALDVKGKVLSNWSDEKVYVEYSAPFWRVRVGSFRHKHEALPLKEKLSEEFPASYIVRVSNIPLKAFNEE